MPLDTITFFEVVLAGFITVRTFRIFSETKEKYSEFEWLALSALCGIFVLITVESIPGMMTELPKVLQNPFATAAVMSIFGVVFGYLASRITRTRLWAWVTNYFGKNGRRDSSDKLWK